MLGKILDFICTRLCSTEIAFDSLSLVQYDFSRTKTRANKIPYFTKHCRITYLYRFLGLSGEKSCKLMINVIIF